MITIDGSQGEGGGQILRFGGCRKPEYDSAVGRINICCYDTIHDEGFRLPEGGEHTILVWPDDDLVAVLNDPRPKNKQGKPNPVPTPRHGIAVEQLASALLASPLVSGTCIEGHDDFAMEISSSVPFSEVFHARCRNPITSQGLAALLAEKGYWGDDSWKVMPRTDALALAQTKPVVDLGKVLLPLGTDDEIAVIELGILEPFARAFAYRVSAASYAREVLELTRCVSDQQRHMITRMILS